MLIISDWCSLSFFSALQKHFCSHIEACACTPIHKPEERDFSYLQDYFYHKARQTFQPYSTNELVYRMYS